MSTTAKQAGAARRVQELQGLQHTEQICRSILRIDPIHGDALHVLGIVAHRQGRQVEATNIIRRALATATEQSSNRAVDRDTLRELDRAVKTYRESIQRDPQSAEVYYALGIEQIETGDFTGAIASFEHALVIRRDWLDAAEKLGEASLHANDSNRAVHILEQLTACCPERVSARRLLAESYVKQGRLEKAALQFQEAIRHSDSDAHLHYQLGRTRLLQGRLSEASESLAVALALDPDHKAAWNERGAALLNLGETEAARSHFGEALKRNPHDPDALCNLALIHLLASEFDQAGKLCRRALQTTPDHAATHNLLGNVLRLQGKLQEAVSSFQQALHLNAAYTEAHNNLALSFQTQGRMEQAVAHYRRAVESRSNCVSAHSNLLLSLHYLPDNDLDKHFSEHLNWAEAHANSLPRMELANSPDPDRKLRVGYLSADFREHPVGTFIEPIITGHDPTQVEVACYSNVAAPDDLTRRLEASVDHWRTTNWRNDDEVARQIVSDGIDILVDLAGHTAGNRLQILARKPAPIQITYLGYGGTTGLETVDYRLTDSVADPVGEPRRHTEELQRLQSGLLCFVPPTDAPPVAPSPVEKNGYVTFGSFNNPSKLNAHCIELWSRLLREISGSRMILKYPAFGDADTRDRCLNLFVEQGIAAERIEFRGGKLPLTDHYAAFGDVDIMLDSFPYSGSTTTCESLWMGIPVVTLRGKSFVGRISASILTTIGRAELIADSLDDYHQRVQALVASNSQLASIRSSLRGQMMSSSLCDPQGYTREIETVYRQVWRKWCREQG